MAETQEQTQQESAQNVEDLPAWAQKVIHDLRDESAGRRTKVQELQQQVDALTAEAQQLQSTIDETDGRAKDFEQQLTGERFAHTRTRLALEKGIPLEVAGALSATTEEDLATQLDALAAFKGQTAEPEKPAPNPAQAAEPAVNADEAKTEFAKQLFNLN